MNKNLKFIILFILAVLTGSQNAVADEGMWMINAIDKALEKNMKQRGLKLSAKEIYNADAEGATVSDAIVSMEFGCTGSMISDKGLLITNHHCARGDVHGISTPENNYLEDGFWAMRSDEEVNIKGKSVYFLKRVIDVTDEVAALREENKKNGNNFGTRRLLFMIEKKYRKETGLEAICSSMWTGSKFYLGLYEVYKDVRLVAAPPMAMASYGGDTDNWEWPQHKCDFALYRVYTAPDGSPAAYSPDNVPMKPKRTLSISLDGYKDGDYTMILGYPGRTDRYSSSFKTDYMSNIQLPIANRIRGEQMAIMERWMNSDPLIRLKYSANYFSLSNVQKLYGGQVQCIKRFDAASKKEVIEKELQEWIDADPERKEKWGHLLTDLKTQYLAVAKPETDAAYFRETLVRGTKFFRMLGTLSAFRNMVVSEEGQDVNEEECCKSKKFCPKKYDRLCRELLYEYEETDPRVEKDLFIYAINEYYDKMDPELLGTYQKEMKQTHSDVAEYLWENSFLVSKEKLEAYLDGEHTIDEMFSDPIYRFFKDVSFGTFNKRISDAEGKYEVGYNEMLYTHALYQMRLDKKIVQYPDANSTMRITYGTVGGIEPRDGVSCDWKTTPAGIIEKYNPDNYEFRLNDRQYLLYRRGNWGKWGFGKDKKTMYVNFLTDNDITGGNSGSPVLNAKGEIIGLAFDGNKESMASDVWYMPGYNKCVCVDIRYVLWTLDCYAGMSHIIEELGL